MFGDMGHGSILFGIGAALWINSEKLRAHATGKKLIFVRYLFTMMGFCSFYSGLIYNEFFAIKPNIWGSCYNLNDP